MSAKELQGAYRRAIVALNEGQWRQAQYMANALLVQAPEHAGVHFVAGVAALQMRELQRASFHLREAVRRNPRRPDYLAQLALLLSTIRCFREAREAAEHAFELGPVDPLSLDALGVVFTQTNAHARAADVFARALELKPGTASLHFNLATSLMFIGDLESAARHYDACLERDPNYWKAYLARAQLRRWTHEENHVDVLESLAACHPAADAQLYLCLALEKELSDLGEIERSYRYLVAGKSAWKTTLDYVPRRDELLFESVMSSFDSSHSDRTGHVSDEPVFVMGMPRSGTTLVERILSSHSAVDSAGELQNFGVQAKRLSGSHSELMLDPETVIAASAIDPAVLGRAYVDSTRPGTGRSRHFIDKLPHNFLYAGLIARALPNAPMICLRRDPLDTVLSNFQQLFALKSPYYEYSFDVVDTARYYVQFDRLMAFWRDRLPGRILEVDYEAIVADQESETRRMLDHCKLNFEIECLDFHRNAAPVATASVVQVRSPIYRSSLHKWRRYGAMLDAPRHLLEAAGVVLENGDPPES